MAEQDMDIETPTTSRGEKRPASVMVDPDDGSEIILTKKARATPDVVKKVKCLKFILSAYIGLSEKIENGPDPYFVNISYGNQITSILFTTFTVLKQKANDIRGNAEKKAMEMKMFSLTSKGKKYTILTKDALDVVSKAAKEQGLEFKRYGVKDKDNWYGTAAPYLDFFIGNNLRMTELRLGHANMPIGKDNGVVRYAPVAKYGLSGSHYVLLEGITFPPEKRSSMAQSVGPMTALLCHVRSDEKYRRKWTAAAKRSMSHIPYIDEILEATKGKKASEISSLLKILGDITLIASSRQAQRMFFPLVALVHIYSRSSETGKMQISKDVSAPAGDDLLKAFNVSGIGGFYLYKLMTTCNWEMEGNLNPIQAGQILFHTIFGTYKEDLTILEKITDLGTWNTREELGKCFQQMTTCQKSVVFEPIRLEYYSKLCSANQTSFYSSSYTQICSAPVFSGHRTQHFSDEFFDQMSESAGQKVAAKTIPQLVAALSDELSNLLAKVRESDKKLEMGTLSWHEMKSLVIDDHGAELDVVFSGDGKFFLGSSK